MEQEFDFVAIGDITTDAFIELKDAKINCDMNRDQCMLCVRFGDKVPYEEMVEVRAVGNSPNAAVSAHRLGLKSALVTNIGDDDNGKACLHQLEAEGIDTKFVKTHPGAKTNYHYVLRYEEERTILVKHHEYEYSLPDMGKPKWIYLSSLGENSLPFHEEIAEYLEANPEVKFAFQPGTFQIKLGVEKLKKMYENTEVFFCNKQEAKRILKTEEEDIKKLLSEVRALGPKIAVITEGPEGAYADDGAEVWHMPMYPDPKPPVDRTGAGDSFSSTFTSVLAMGAGIPEALTWGPINSMSVVQHIGAQAGLLKKDAMERYEKEAPEDYKPAKVA